MTQRIALLALVGVACVDDRDGTDEPSGTEPEEAWLIGVRVRTPDSRSVFAAIVPDPSEPATVDLSTAVEVGGTSRLFVYDGHVYAMDGETGEINRFAINDDNTLEQVGRFSMQGEGVTTFRSTFAFISPDRAYYFDLNNDQIVVWDPTAMIVVESIDFEPPDRSPLDIAGASPQVSGDRVIIQLMKTTFNFMSRPLPYRPRWATSGAPS